MKNQRERSDSECSARQNAIQRKKRRTQPKPKKIKQKTGRGCKKNAANKTKKIVKEDPKPKVPGRPKKTKMDSVHEERYFAVKLIIEIIAFMSWGFNESYGLDVESGFNDT